MTSEKRKEIANQIAKITLDILGSGSTTLSQISTKRIHIYGNYSYISDKQMMLDLHSMKLSLINLGKMAYEGAEALKKIIDSNPDEPELFLTNEDLQDDNPVEGVDY